jgi:plastocyanin
MHGVLRYGSGLVAVGVVWVGASCGEGGGEVTDPPPGTGIQVTVMRDGAGSPGVGVRLYAAGAGSPQSTASTNSEGVASFGNLAAGSYEVEVEVPTGAELEDGPARRPVAVQTGASASVTFRLASEPLTGVVEVRLTLGLAFNPSQVTIARGATVRWVNDGAMFHTITPQGHSEFSEGTVTQAGDTFEHRFENVGDFPYFCSPHLGAGMTGVVRVR